MATMINMTCVKFVKRILALLVVIFSCTLPAFAAVRMLRADGKHLFILSGQSNMREPLPSAFKECVSRVFGEDKVIVLTGARPSQSINQWYKQWTPPEGVDASKVKDIGSIYDSLMISVEGGIRNKELASVTFVWMQGEADAESGWGAVYEKSFYGVLDQIKTDLRVGSVNFVIGRINDYWLSDKGVVDGDLVRGLQAKFGDDNANGDWVDTDDLNTGLNPWGIYEVDGGHFPNAGYRALGKRFARKVCLLIEPDRKLDDTIFIEGFIDSADDIKGHSAVDKGITGTMPAVRLSKLLDGKHGTADAKDEAWLEFADKVDKVSFDVDLGESKKVSAVGIGFLYDKNFGADLPVALDISSSADGLHFQRLTNNRIKLFYNPAQREKWAKNAEPSPHMVLLELKDLDMRFIRFEIEKKMQDRILLDEIVVNPVAK
jgi:hypothetical protein